MKKLGIFCLLVTCIGLQSCKNDKSEKALEVKEVKDATSTQCYQAIYERDTLNLKLLTFNNGEINGNMEMAIENMPKKVGEIVGEFKGDTLFASYTFIQGSNKEKTFKNPMAFLKRGDQLILGNGQIQITMGASHFVKGEPIDFDKVKYKFSPVACAEKQ